MANVTEPGFVHFLAQNIGATDDALRFLLSVFAGYPLAFIHRLFLHGRPPTVQHIYFILSGLLLFYFNFGTDLIHAVINVILIHLLIIFSGGTTFSVAAAFIFNTSYLVIGYYLNSSYDYVITWTTPHCVLTLRLTAVVLDVYDGRKKEEKLSSEQKETVLHKSPSILELLGQTFFFGAFLAGPQFSMRRYLSFTQGAFTDPQTKAAPASVMPGLTRLLLGVFYVFLYQVVSIFLTENFLYSDEFTKLGFITRCALILIVGRIFLCRYIGIWLITEGSCILTGITYNGKDVNGNNLWDGCTNIKLYQLEMASTFRDIIASFNHNTNMWMSRYIFKRLRFLGNKVLSQGVTLFYLALWHGLHSGYYMCFMLEFVMVNAEAKIVQIVQKSPVILKITSIPSVKSVLWVVNKLIVTFSLSYALVSFITLDFRIYLKIYSSVYFIAHAAYLSVIVLNIFIQPVLSSQGQQSSDHHVVDGKKNGKDL
ncbi:hypothetical protein ScPMuIL_009675 [Solemya velum]